VYFLDLTGTRLLKGFILLLYHLFFLFIVFLLFSVIVIVRNYFVQTCKITRKINNLDSCKPYQGMEMENCKFQNKNPKLKTLNGVGYVSERTMGLWPLQLQLDPPAGPWVVGGPSSRWT